MRKVVVLVESLAIMVTLWGWTYHFIYSFVKFLSHQWRVSSGMLRALLSFLFASVYPRKSFLSFHCVLQLHTVQGTKDTLLTKSLFPQVAELENSSGLFIHICVDRLVNSCIYSVSESVNKYVFEHVLPTRHFSGSWVTGLRPAPNFIWPVEGHQWGSPVRSLPTLLSWSSEESLACTLKASQLKSERDTTPPQTAAPDVPCPLHCCPQECV